MTEQGAGQGAAGGSPANWYPDPSNAAQLRYWDGTAWTESTAPRTSAPGVAATPRVMLPPDAAARRHRNTLIIIWVAVGAFVLLLVFGVMAAVAIPIFNAQREKAMDTSAEADVSTLGRDIAWYYVDNVGPVPQITVSGGDYHLPGGVAGYDVEPVSPHVALGGVSGTSATNWCVWVTNPEGLYKDFKYSARDGLARGRC